MFQFSCSWANFNLFCRFISRIKGFLAATCDFKQASCYRLRIVWGDTLSRKFLHMFLAEINLFHIACFFINLSSDSEVFLNLPEPIFLSLVPLVSYCFMKYLIVPSLLLNLLPISLLDTFDFQQAIICPSFLKLC